jgi:serine protease Do
MSKHTAIGTIIVLSLGLVLGAAIVSGLGGFTFSFAEGSIRQFNKQPLYIPGPEVSNLNDAFSQVAEIATPQVVYINVKSKSSVPQVWPFGNSHPDVPQRGSGSGIILTTDGYIMTNSHVVEGAIEDGITVTLSDARELPAVVIGTDKSTDIAVIKVEANNLQAASLGNSDEIRVGEWVLAVGNPLGLTSTVTAGIVSAISRSVDLNVDSYAIENFIQTDAVVNPGNSGGALVNLNGQVIGVNTAIATGGMGKSYIGYSFAVPINLAETVAKGIMKYGRYVRGFIGVSIRTLDVKQAKALGLESYKGVLIENVIPDGAGEEAGLEAGDVIVEVAGKPVTSASELQARVGTHQPGDAVELKIFHMGKYITKSVILKGRDGEKTIADAKEPKEKVEKKKEARLSDGLSFDKAGFTVIDLNAQTKKQFKRESGVFVIDVKRFGPAFENDLRKGVVIFEARKGAKVTKIDDTDDLNDVLGELRENEAVLLRIQTDGGNTAFIPIEGPV